MQDLLTTRTYCTTAVPAARIHMHTFPWMHACKLANSSRNHSQDSHPQTTILKPTHPEANKTGTYRPQGVLTTLSPQARRPHDLAFKKASSAQTLLTGPHLTSFVIPTPYEHIKPFETKNVSHHHHHQAALRTFTQGNRYFPKSYHVLRSLHRYVA